jgi:hypothetical protein
VEYDGSDLPDKVASRSDFNKHMNDPCIKLVNVITWCNEQISYYGGTLGCARVGLPGIIAIRSYPGKGDDFNRKVEPITWLHEYGHTQGLKHNESDANALMTPGISPDTTGINKDECNSLSAGPTGTGSASAALPRDAIGRNGFRNVGVIGGDAEILPAGGEIVSAADLESFIRVGPTARYPVETAKKFSQDVRKTEKYMSDPDYIGYRANIIALLAVIGDKKTMPLLLGIIEAPFGARPNDLDIYVRLASLTSLAAIINRTNFIGSGGEYLRALEAASDPEFWVSKMALTRASSVSQNVLTISLPANGHQDRPKPFTEAEILSWSDVLATQAYRAYAITGREDVGRRLTSDQRKAVSSSKNAAVPKDILEDRQEQVDEAIRLHTKSRKQGALSVFQ